MQILLLNKTEKVIHPEASDRTDARHIKVSLVLRAKRVGEKNQELYDKASIKFRVPWKR